MEKLLNFIFQPNCISCKKTGAILCANCLERCKILEYDYCLVCDKFSYFGVTLPSCASSLSPSSVFSVYLYEGIPRYCVKKAKFQSKEFAALKVLTAAALAHMLACGRSDTGYTVVPVPVSNEKYRQRGFNQADLIATILAKTLKLPINRQLLKRKVDTRAQFISGREDRFANVKDAFVVNPRTFVETRKYLIVDDICTTGATLLESTKALKTTGDCEVACFTLCKTQKIYV